MQTFVPIPNSMVESLMVLDWRRLGKQRVETYQLMRTNLGITRGWRSHPAARMWLGHERALSQYGAISCRLWRHMGHRDTLLPHFELWEKELPDTGRPRWWGDARVHISHQSNLLRKARTMTDEEMVIMQMPRDFYDSKFPHVSDDLPYFWPV